MNTEEELKKEIERIEKEDKDYILKVALIKKGNKDYKKICKKLFDEEGRWILDKKLEIPELEAHLKGFQEGKSEGYKLGLQQRIIVAKQDEIKFLTGMKEKVRKLWMKSVENSATRFYLNLIEKEIDKRLQELKK